MLTNLQEKLKTLARDHRTTICYDNFNLKDTVRDHILGSTDQMLNLTNAVVMECEDLPPDGLTQDMLNTSTPLPLESIARSPAVTGEDGDVGSGIHRFLIASALHNIHKDAVEHVVGKDDPFNVLRFPTVERLPTRTTKYWQMAGIWENEGTLKGSLAVHESIFQQLNVEQTDDSWATRMWLMHGDQMTASHNRKIKKLRYTARLPFDRRKWMLSPTGLFHVQYNLLCTIIRTHHSPPEGEFRSRHSLRSNATMMGRPDVS